MSTLEGKLEHKENKKIELYWEDNLEIVLKDKKTKRGNTS